MIEIFLTQGQVAWIDDQDAGLVGRYVWHALKHDRGFYAATNIRLPDGRWTTLSMHCLLMGRKGIDHIDGNGLNNVRSNLRLATPSQNRANSRLPRTNTSGYRGVYFDRSSRKWRATIRVDQQHKHLGLYEDIRDAARARDAAALEYFGDFARLNFRTEGVQ